MTRRTSGSRRGCLPWILGLVLLWVWFSGSDEDWQESELSIQQFDPRSPRRPLPDIGESFIIAEAGPQQDSQGTAFAVDSDGAWLTAQHVTTGCDRLGLADDNRVDAITDVLESSEADVSILRSGPVAQFALRVADQAPEIGDYGYHMGFPAGVPTVVVSRFIGAALAVRGGPGGAEEPIFAWAEGDRLPPADGSLGGISGGPTFDTGGRVVGVNAASTPRRGRVLTTDPSAILRLVAASGAVDDPGAAVALPSPLAAQRLFLELLDLGIIRQVYCDVR